MESGRGWSGRNRRLLMPSMPKMRSQLQFASRPAGRESAGPSSACCRRLSDANAPVRSSKPEEKTNFLWFNAQRVTVLTGLLCFDEETRR